VFSARLPVLNDLRLLIRVMRRGRWPAAGEGDPMKAAMRIWDVLVFLASATLFGWCLWTMILR
jgi:hypothetical protein